ncbi:MAG: HEAT repeat domain-containing protein, partial [Candidatus Limnocylindrales bacterium]
LGKIADPRAAKALVVALGDPDQHFRRSAAEALIKISGGAFKPLAAALVDADPTRRRLAREVLDRTGWLPDSSEAGARYWIAKRQWPRVVEIGPRAVRPLLWALQFEDEQGRGEAAAALGRLGNARAVAPLCACLKVEDAGLRQTAARALGEICDARAIGPLIDFLGDSSELMRGAVAEALAKIGEPAVKPLLAALGDADALVRRAATEALWQIGEPAVEPLVAVLGDANVLVRRAATVALGRTGDSRAVNPLIACLGDAERTVRQSAAEALCELGPLAVQPLCDSLNGNDERLRMQAAKVLISLYESGRLGEEQKAAILSQRGAIAGMHADRLGQHTDESMPTESGHADLSYHHDQHIIFAVGESIAPDGTDAHTAEAPAAEPAPSAWRDEASTEHVQR